MACELSGDDTFACSLVGSSVVKQFVTATVAVNSSENVSSEKKTAVMLKLSWWVSMSDKRPGPRSLRDFTKLFCWLSCLP